MMLEADSKPVNWGLLVTDTRCRGRTVPPRSKPAHAQPDRRLEGYAWRCQQKE